MHVSEPCVIVCVAETKRNTSAFLSWQCEFAATEMSNIDTNARHDGTGKNERNASAVSRVTPKMHLAAGAWRSVVISNLSPHELALSQNPKAQPYLGIPPTTGYLSWVVVRIECPVIGVRVLRDRHWEARALQGGFFSQGGGRAGKHDL